VPRPNLFEHLIERRMTRFLQAPLSVRSAVAVIVTATAVVVVMSGVAMRLFDHSEYSNVWVGMWWAVQTVTTVGYGDVTPRHVSGRIIASVVLLYGIGFLTITIAAITSTFVTRAEREQGVALSRDDLDDVSARLERIEQQLGQLTDAPR
jgi:voltage-gated potassium channel